MALLKEEQEICITKLATENVFEVYVSDKRYVTKMNKIGAVPYKVEYMEGEEVGWFYKIDEKQVLLREKPKKRVLSDKQKQEMAERLRLSRENRD